MSLRGRVPPKASPMEYNTHSCQVSEWYSVSECATVSALLYQRMAASAVMRHTSTTHSICYCMICRMNHHVDQFQLSMALAVQHGSE